MEVLQDPRAIDLPADDQLWRALLEPVREECFAALRDQSPGWSVPELLADGITFSQCVKEGQSLGMARASCVIDASPDAVLEFLGTTESWNTNKLDPNHNGDGRDLERRDYGPGEFFVVSSATYKVQWPIWDREFLWALKRERTADGGAIFFSRSIKNHRACPLRINDNVRGIVLLNMLVASPLEGGKKSKVELVTSVDPMGWIPAVAVNSSLKSNTGQLSVATNYFRGKK